MSIPPIATSITPGDPSANDTVPISMTVPKPLSPANAKVVPPAPKGAVSILVSMEDVSQSNRSVPGDRLDAAPAPVWNGREVALIREESLDNVSCEICCICLIIICHLGTFAMAITGSIMYARNKDASGNDSNGQYLKKVATILMIVGWSTFCCGSAGFFLIRVKKE